MSGQPVGQEWLKRQFNLSDFTLTHASFIGTVHNIELTSRGNIEETYGRKYAVENTPLSHVEFSLKYDDLSLDFLKAVFTNISEEDVSAYIDASPAGINRRRIGFLYEFLTAKIVKLPRSVSGNYANLLDEDRYVTGDTVKDSKWRINNNLLGTFEYCPIVRKTKALTELLETDTHEKIKDLKKEYSPDVFQRAISYLYKKETRSSYEIEREEPSPDRMERFIAILSSGGTETNERLVARQRLTALQNAIVDPRFAAEGYRNFQNYVSESRPNATENIHYVCPPPELVGELMHGLWEASVKSQYIYPEVHAAMLSFGFIFIHPFEDGNGRIHRFLIHDVLSYHKLVPEGMIIPVSAHMLNHMRDYDTTLEKYSRPLIQKVRYKRLEDATIEITNTSDVEGYFRFPDLTEQCTYLIQTIHATLTEDMPDELRFIQRYDEVKRELQNIVDMPDRDINLMLTFFHQNNGLFPNRRRERFNKLTDEEIARMQSAYRKVFELD